MTKENKERVMKAIEEHNKTAPAENQLDVYEVFDSMDSISDEEAENIINQLKNDNE